MNIVDHTLSSFQKSNNAASYKKLLLKMQLVEIFYKEGLKTISELCDITKNSIPSMTVVLNELADAGWIKNYGIGESKGGRKPSLYGLDPLSGYIVGIDLSRSYTRICIFNMFNESIGGIKEVNKGLDTSKDILEILKKETSELLTLQNIKNEQVIGYGIAIPGLIDIRKGVSYSYTQFGSGNLNSIFTELFDRPAYVEHDTKSMVLGEAWFGQAKNTSNALFLNIGEAIGLGMILNGKLYQGHSGFSGEFGHIQMVSDGVLCYCGKVGCLETVASGKALVKKSIVGIGDGKSSLISKLTNNLIQEIKLDTIINSALQGDQFALELFEEASEYLAKGISTLIHLFNPEIIIIGGDMSCAGSLLIDLLRHKINKYTMIKLKQDTQLVLSELSEKAGLLGAIPVVMSNAFVIPTHLVQF